MTIDLLRLLFDTGLFVLIWIVQLIIYPGFQFYSSENLRRWHEKYTPRIGCIVLPLMLGQLTTIFLQLFSDTNSYTLGSFLIVVLIWISTFTLFIPTHKAISSGLANESLLQKLVSQNWMRTILWTVLFLFSFLKAI